MRSFNKFLLTALAGLTGLTPLTGQTVLSLTTKNIGLVRESRELDLKSGEQSVILKNVAGQLIPSSIFTDGGGFEIVEQTFEAKPRPEEQLLKRALNKKITLVHPEMGLIAGTLLSATPAMIVLRDSNGDYQMIPRSKALRVVIPAGETAARPLQMEPQLRWRLKTDRAGKKNFRLSYLTHGLNWSADYVALLSAREDKLRLSSRVTLENNSGRDYQQARIKLLAGDVNIEKIRGGRGYELKTMDMVLPAAGEKSFFDFHLYTINRSTDLADGQSVQMPLFPEQVVAVTKRYRLYAERPDKVNVLLTFKNDKKSGPGRPLPAGKVRVFKEDEGEPVFIGEKSMDHTPRGAQVELVLGSAFDISASRQQRVERPAKNMERQRVSYTLHNHKKEAVRLEIWESFPNRTEVEVLKSDIEVTGIANGRIRMVMLLPANEKKEIHIDYQYKW